MVEPDSDNGGGGGDGRAPLPMLRDMREGEARNVADFVVIELMARGSLHDVIQHHAINSDDAWPWSERLRMLSDVAEGMAQMHHKRYIHRDLKPDNVLINAEGVCKIADLGLSRNDEAFDVANIASLEQRRDQQGRIALTAAGGTPPCT